MTLITYVSRVHFADGVLEVALSSELELNQLSRPILVAEQSVFGKEFSERVIAGLPFWCEYNSHEIQAGINPKNAISNLLQQLRADRSDVVIAFGSEMALSIADSCCKQIGSDAFDRNQSTSTSPKLIAIPGVDGIPTMSLRRSDNALTGGIANGIQPTAVVIDPTLMLGESVERTSGAIAETLARCLSAHFSDGYNPPADGIALDGIKRILRNFNPMMHDDSLEMRRELMAASLNGTLAMQKETGLSHELCEILIRNAPQPVCKGALLRLLILVEAELLERSWTPQHSSEVCVAMGLPAGTDLNAWLSSILERLPLPGSLSDLGITPSQISNATQELACGRFAALATENLAAMLSAAMLPYREELTEPERI